MATANKKATAEATPEKKKAGRPPKAPVEPVAGLAGENGAKVQADTAARILNSLAEDLAADNKVKLSKEGAVVVPAQKGNVEVAYFAATDADKCGAYFQIASDVIDAKGAKDKRYLYAVTAAALGFEGVVKALRKKVYDVGEVANGAA